VDDQALADAVNRALTELTAAVDAARAAGLSVEVSVTDFKTDGKSSTVVGAKIQRVEMKDYSVNTLRAT
jgi:hypothetical protein